MKKQDNQSADLTALAAATFAAGQKFRAKNPPPPAPKSWPAEIALAVALIVIAWGAGVIEPRSPVPVPLVGGFVIVVGVARAIGQELAEGWGARRLGIVTVVLLTVSLVLYQQFELHDLKKAGAWTAYHVAVWFIVLLVFETPSLWRAYLRWWKVRSRRLADRHASERSKYYKHAPAP